jgi:LIM domain kinase 1
MSPEILLGEEFDLPTDVYSLGVIFCEILARKLADDVTFKVVGSCTCTPTMPL